MILVEGIREQGGTLLHSVNFAGCQASSSCRPGQKQKWVAEFSPHFCLW